VIANGGIIAAVFFCGEIEHMKALVHCIIVLAIMLSAIIIARDAIAVPSLSKPVDTVRFYRCTNGMGKVSLQDKPCDKTSKQEVRDMVRLKTMPPSRPEANVPKSAPPPVAPAVVQTPVALIPPPDLYQCTNYEGKTRDSENYDPNPRCEPLWALGYHVDYLPIEQRGRYCRWIEDSCVRYEGRALCDRWFAKQKQAQADVRYAFSSTLAYRKSELARITQIVNTSCR
jgi:hypothetical protein